MSDSTSSLSDNDDNFEGNEVFRKKLLNDTDKYGNNKDLPDGIAKDIVENKPIYLHCKAGADRTGMICLFVEAICGVKRDDIDRDYYMNAQEALEYGIIDQIL